MRAQQYLDIHQGRPVMMLDHEVPGDKAWTRDTVSPRDWEVHLPEQALQEIDAVLALLRRNPLPRDLLSPDQFELSACRKVMARVKHNLVDGMGLAVVDKLDWERIGREEAISVYWILGQFIAPPVATKWDGTMIYDVTDTGRKYGFGVRGSWTNAELYFHTDNAFGTALPDYVSLYCINPAKEGGVSRFCSLYHVHNQLLNRHPRLLQRLYHPMYFDRQAEHAPDDPQVSWAPMFSYDGERLNARLSSTLVRRGHELMGEAMDGELAEALEALEEILEDPELWAEFVIGKGQMQYLNNKECAHFRSEFVDHDDPALKRHLVRIWYREWGRRFYNG